MIINSNLVIHNHEFNRFAPHQKPSIIDHVVTNCPQHIDNVITKPSIISDHCSLTFNYKAKPDIFWPRFRISRDQSKLSKQNLIYEVQNDPLLQNLYYISDPNQVANTLQTQLNLIINKLAQKTRVQVRNKKNIPKESFCLKRK